MKKKKIVLPIALTAIGVTAAVPSLMAMTSCSKQPTLLTINGKDSLEVGEAANYSVNTQDRLFWIIDPSYTENAYVDATGNVTALKAGSFILYAATIGANKEIINYGSKTISITVGQTKNIPLNFLNIEGDVLKGFKYEGLDLSPFDTLFVPATVHFVSSFAFWNGIESTMPSSIKHLIFEDNVPGGFCYTIGEQAFYHSSLETVQLPNGIKNIESRAFGFCDKLETCNFPSGLSYIGEESFMLTKLRYVIFNEKRKFEGTPLAKCPWIKEGEGDVDNNSRVTYIGKRAFYNCQHLTYVRMTSYKDVCPYLNGTDWNDSPFACEDSTQGEIIESKIKVIDLTNYHLIECDSEALAPNLPTIFAKRADVHPSGFTFTIRIRDFYNNLPTTDKEKMRQIVDNIANCFGFAPPGVATPTQFADGVYIDWYSNYYNFMLNFEKPGYHVNSDGTCGNDEWISHNIIPIDMFSKYYDGQVEVSLQSASPIELIDSTTTPGFKQLHLPKNAVTAPTESQMLSKIVAAAVKVKFIKIDGQRDFTATRTIEVKFL